MAEVLVLVEHSEGALRKVTGELLTAAARIGSPSAVVVGIPGTSDPLAAELAALGAEKIYVAESDDAATYLITPAVAALAAASALASPAAILLSASVDGREIAGRLAVRLDSGMLADVVDIDSDIVGTHSVFGGSYTVHAKVTRGIPVVTIRANSIDAAPSPGAGTRVPVEFSVDPAASAVVVAVHVEPAGDRPELGGATVVVSGGRGVGSAENFPVVENLADALGGAVGASRAAVDSGYYPHQFQVGQTGTTVSPQLYIALGISGAIQHRAGMQTAKTIVAVNKDSDAPIFEIADYGVVGDLFKVAPQLTEAVAAHKG
ncbi:electron transfer flavoprotein subunit alpha/FixB family protein [Nakamurella antarctica]|uniref:Electron transfer flavoprotein subunit alpha/FixB family protein n=1 Tax=Nakamurella antarctica TaxID=1902245 RepID=A0A3G8ZSS5_9ACTN|nr:electron transfer flavoprotein subunit alpha/FixB family protein [Nakamurella antarctica]AZI57544.1 electron transfer flavoprotein subunit alpha/FixB family protein [Nakamurella antarctica]